MYIIVCLFWAELLLSWTETPVNQQLRFNTQNNDAHKSIKLTMKRSDQVTSQLSGKGKNWKHKTHLPLLSIHAFPSPQHIKYKSQRQEPIKESYTRQMVFHLCNRLKEPHCTEERRREEEETRKEERSLGMWSCLLQQYVKEKSTVFTLTIPTAVAKNRTKQTPETCWQIPDIPQLKSNFHAAWNRYTLWKEEHVTSYSDDTLTIW